MADKEDDLEIELEGGDDIEVELETEVKSEPKTPKQTVEAKTKDKPAPRTRTRVNPDPVIDAVPTPEEALAEAKAHAEQETTARKAAEATAQSERTAREAAERSAQAAIKAAEEHQDRANNTELTLIENNIASMQEQLTSHESAFEKAAEAGEFKNMAAIQTKIAKVSAALDRLESTKVDLEANPRKTQTTEGSVREPDNTSAVEKYLRGFAPNAQNFLRQHLDCVAPSVGGDPVKHNRMMAGHYAAVAKGLAEGTDIYFKELESHINPVAAKVEPEPEPAVSRAAQTRPAASPSAPPTRDAPSASGQPQRTSRTVTLTKEQQEAAKLSWPKLPEKEAYGLYARNLLELEAEGKIGRLTH